MCGDNNENESTRFGGDGLIRHAIGFKCVGLQFSRLARFGDCRIFWSVFKLSQNYPQQLPTDHDQPWRKFNFKSHPDEYLNAVLQYCYDGNVDVDWVVQNNRKRAWYGAPWLHTSASGREFIHGLTSERNSRAGELSYNQSVDFQNWAVGFYNALGGYTIGQVWKNPDAPDPSAARFPEGTVAVKLLFTQADEKQVPFLAGAPEWTANIYDLAGQRPPSPPKDLPRKPQTLRLLQIDIAVRDPDANSTTGWVFGTFIYNKDARGKTAWEKMVPIGLMFGNDPDLTKTKAQLGQKLKETILSKQPKSVQHLGYGGRLCGPVDNPNSSCLSCHSTAQFPIDLNAAIMPTHKSPKDGSVVNYDSDIWMDWFRNVKSGTPFNKGVPYLCQDVDSLDYSMELSVGLARFYEAKGQQPVCGNRLMNARAGIPNQTNFFNREGEVTGPPHVMPVRNPGK